MAGPLASAIPAATAEASSTHPMLQAIASPRRGSRGGANRWSATMRLAPPPAAAARVKASSMVARCSDGHDVATVARALATRTAAERVAVS